MCHAVGFLVAVVDYVICLHWHRLIKNIEDKPKFWEGKMWYKLINAWAFSDFGVCTAGCPHSLHLCLFKSAVQRLFASRIDCRDISGDGASGRLSAEQSLSSETKE